MKVTVIGIGSLGGFLCRNIADIEFVDEIVLVDHDVVEPKNSFKSIYSYMNVGEYKVDALAKIIKNNVTVIKVKENYIEGTTKLPQSDLVIDCRDIVCNRGKEIDVRFYISQNTLIADCRQQSCTSDYSGGYTSELTKLEIKKAAFFASQYIESNQINNMITNNLVQKIELNMIKNTISESIEESVSNKMDIIYENNEHLDRLQCLEETIEPIIKSNSKDDLDIFIGERPPFSSMKTTTKYTTIPKNKLKNPHNVLQELTKILSNQPGIKNYIILMKKKGNIEYVELLEETGGA